MTPLGREMRSRLISLVSQLVEVSISGSPTKQPCGFGLLYRAPSERWGPDPAFAFLQRLLMLIGPNVGFGVVVRTQWPSVIASG